ncbi:uncharacterized protein B0H64DRAFT_34014 [Chaetomium fimeti]|uniref:Uncharacterized protein n=1 Tax=Chaetomium fimeti TaxID=1854472 RepID=A0AAE0LXJ2_9PEZI|nr:hypothetical protein B0H64DRAFT_34014 [Chaetomium fimeti]
MHVQHLADAPAASIVPASSALRLSRISALNVLESGRDFHQTRCTYRHKGVRKAQQERVCGHGLTTKKGRGGGPPFPTSFWPGRSFAADLAENEGQDSAVREKPEACMSRPVWTYGKYMQEGQTDGHPSMTPKKRNNLARNVKLGVFGFPASPLPITLWTETRRGNCWGGPRSRYLVRTPRDKEMVRMGGDGTFPQTISTGARADPLDLDRPSPQSTQCPSSRVWTPSNLQPPPPLARRVGPGQSAPDRNRKHTKPQHPPPPCRIPSSVCTLTHLPIRNLSPSHECVAPD